MRVLHLYAGNLYGGIERNLVALAEMQSLAPGMEPSFGLCFEGRLSGELRALGARVVPLGSVRARYPWQVRRVRARVRQAAADGACDVALTHSCWGQGLFGPALRSAGVPQAMYLNNIIGGEGIWEAWARRHPPDRLLTASRTMADSAPRLYPGLTPHVVYCPVARPARGAGREAMRRALGAEAGEVVILMAARLEPYKGLSLLLDALALLPAEARWTAWIAGPAPRRPQEARFLQARRGQAERLGIASRVRWLGERNDLDALLGAADLFCHPNLTPEPLGRVFAEALWAETPVLATALGGALEIITPETGELTPPEPAAVAGALQAWIADPARRTRAGAAGPARAGALFDPTRQMARLETELRETAASTAAGSTA